MFASLQRPPALAWWRSLKFRIVALCVLAGLGATASTIVVVQHTERATFLQLWQDRARLEAERHAAEVAARLVRLKQVLAGAATRIDPAMLAQPDTLADVLRGSPDFVGAFEAAVVTDASGQSLLRLDKGRPSNALPQLGQTEYFAHAMASTLPVTSQPFVGQLLKLPLVAVVQALRGADGRPYGVLAASVRLGRPDLLASAVRAESEGGLSVVIDRDGVVLAHPDATQAMARAADLPALADAMRNWVAQDRPNLASLPMGAQATQVASFARIAGSGWLVLRISHQADAWAWLNAAQEGITSKALLLMLPVLGLCALLAWLMTRPLSELRRRTEHALRVEHQASPQPPWPRMGGEVGALAQAFEQVIEQSRSRHQAAQDMLARLEAVLNHAQAGVAFTRLSHFELVSRHFCATFGVQPEQVLGKPTRVIYPSDEAYTALGEQARPAFMANGAYEGELELVRSNGENFWASMRGRAVVPGNLAAGTIWIIEDITQARAQREQLTQAAHQDVLTGLTNRRAFEALMSKAVAASEQAPFSALFMDLDGFKQVNDTAGHAAGDALLKGIAQRLEASVRQSDTVARLGGDEFAVLLPRCPAPQAMRVAEKLRAAVEAAVLHWEGAEYTVGASIGMVHVEGHYKDAAEVLRAADAACYAAKRGGRNQVVNHADMPAFVATGPSQPAVLDEAAA